MPMIDDKRHRSASVGREKRKEVWTLSDVSTRPCTRWLSTRLSVVKSHSRKKDLDGQYLGSEDSLYASIGCRQVLDYDYV